MYQSWTKFVNYKWTKCHRSIRPYRAWLIPVLIVIEIAIRFEKLKNRGRRRCGDIHRKRRRSKEKKKKKKKRYRAYWNVHTVACEKYSNNFEKSKRELSLILLLLYPEWVWIIYSTIHIIYSCVSCCDNLWEHNQKLITWMVHDVLIALPCEKKKEKKKKREKKEKRKRKERKKLTTTK